MHIRFSVFAIGVSLLYTTPARSDQTIDWSSFVGSSLFDSTGDVFSDTWTIALGTFGDTFEPMVGNTVDWSANWIELDTAVYNDDPPFGFSSSVVISDVDRADEQVYMWFYNNQVGDETSEWALLTDNAWNVASEAELQGGQDVSPETFEMNLAGEVIWGGLNSTPSGGGERSDDPSPFDLQTHTFAPPIPEPSVVSVLVLSMMFLTGLRNRPQN
ncbi:MAG: hypothetical protein AAGA58_05060 [Verrucomicrobiota bacterium]